jgi:hypothetical protein
MTILTVSEYLYGGQIRESVFEPLLADRHQELIAHRSIGLRLRWWCAIAAAFVTCAPRATFGRLPSSLVIDLGKRAVVFGTLGYAVQWLALIMETSRGRGGFPPSVATTVPFLIIPVIWRIWVSSIPQHQKRLLAALCATTCMALSANGAENWLVWLGYAAGIAWLAAWSWRLGDPNLPEKYQTIINGSYRVAGVASAMCVAFWPAQLAMQISLLTPFPLRLLMIYIFAGVIALYIEDVPRENAGIDRLEA